MPKKKVTKKIPKGLPTACPKCKYKLTDDDSVYRTYTISGHNNEGAFKEDGSLDWDGITRCSNCNVILTFLS